MHVDVRYSTLRRMPGAYPAKTPFVNCLTITRFSTAMPLTKSLGRLMSKTRIGMCGSAVEVDAFVTLSNVFKVTVLLTATLSAVLNVMEPAGFTPVQIRSKHVAPARQAPVAERSRSLTILT